MTEMVTNINTYFVDLAAHHLWATERLLSGSIAPLSEADYRADMKLFFRSIHGTLNHLLVAERIWQPRFMENVSPRLSLDAELFTEREPLRAALQAAAARWGEWLATLAPADLEGPLHYTRSDGQQTVVPKAATLGHVFNHGTHHRGQITAALTALGHAAPELDWVRQLQQQTD